MRQRFSIGPVVGRDFWSKERAKMDIDRGPCMSESGFIVRPLISQRETSSRVRDYLSSPRDGVDQAPCESQIDRGIVGELG